MSVYLCNEKHWFKTRNKKYPAKTICVFFLSLFHLFFISFYIISQWTWFYFDSTLLFIYVIFHSSLLTLFFFFLKLSFYHQFFCLIFFSLFFFPSSNIISHMFVIFLEDFPIWLTHHGWKKKLKKTKKKIMSILSSHFFFTFLLHTKTHSNSAFSQRHISRTANSTNHHKLCAFWFTPSEFSRIEVSFLRVEFAFFFTKLFPNTKKILYKLQFVQITFIFPISFLFHLKLLSNPIFVS